MPTSDTHIDDISRSIQDWLRDAVSDVDFEFVSNFQTREQDRPSGAKPRIEICFESVVNEKPDRASLNRADVFLLTYLVRVMGSDALINQRVFSEIYFKAYAGGEFKLREPTRQGEGLGDPGAKPPHLALVARLVRPAEVTAPRLVTDPLNLKLRSLGRIDGRVVTDDGKPLMRAEVHAPSLDKRAVSDAAGHFTIPGAPGVGTIALTVKARNRSVDVLFDIEKQAEIVIVMPKENQHA